MSADNTLYITKWDDGYRVTMVLGDDHIEEMESDDVDSNEFLTELKEYVEDFSQVLGPFDTFEKAQEFAWEWEDADIIEYGVKNKGIGEDGKLINLGKYNGNY